jgi:hypothetical protein
VVGDVLRRDGGAWVLVNDDDVRPGGRAAAGPPRAPWHEQRPDRLGPRAPAGRDRRDSGGRASRGDLVEVAGRIVRTDPSDGGGLTLRATNLQILAPAVAVDEPLDLPQLWLAIGVLTVAAGLTVVRRRAVTRR